MPARKRNLWPFSSAKRKRVVRSKAELASIAETHRRAEQGYLSGGVPRSSGRPTTAAATYKGYLIRHMEDDTFVIPKLDSESHFDSLKDAKQFLDSWKRNPATAKKLLRESQKGGRGVLKFYDTLTGTVGQLTGVPRKIAGTLVGERNVKKNRPYSIADEKGVGIGLYQSQAEAFAEARSLADSGQRVEVIWKGEKGYQGRWFGKKSRGNPVNPKDEAERMYEAFHGKPPEGETVVQEELHEHEHLATLGVLVNFRVATLTGFDVLIGAEDADAKGQDYDETAADADTIFLASNEDGTQLYFKGGDESLPLDKFKMGQGTDWFRDDMIVGILYEVTYRTKKKFDKFQLTDYYHELGEETGDQPMLRYDPLSPHLYVSGGKYKIKVPLIGVSPGIEN